MADETNTPESQMEAELQELFAGSPPATGSESAADPKVGTDTKQEGVPPPTPPAETPAAEETPEELTDLEKKLKALEELDKPEGEVKPDGEQKPEAKAPVLTEEQQIILQHIPDARTAEAVVSIANNHAALEDAFESGNFELVDNMFTHWNKQAYEAFEEHIYQKYIGKDGVWVKRFIAEQEAKANGNEYELKKQSALERKVQELEAQVKGRQQQETQAEAQRREQQVYTNYNNEIERLFSVVGITEEADKKFIKSAINSEVVANKKVANEIRQGSYKGLIQIFKTNSNTYLTRDKAFTRSTEKKIEDQSKKKVPIGGGGSPTQQQTTADHDFKGVKRGEEDSALESKLGSFFSKFKRK
jgi:hypothetical protein